MNFRIANKILQEKVISADTAAQMIKEGMTLGFSGFTAVGYPKEIPQAIAAKGSAGNLTIIAGASAGDELDGTLARAGLISRRTPFNVSKDLRQGINNGQIYYCDEHLGHLPQMLRAGILGKVDFAIIECCRILEDGSIVPTLSAGASNALVEIADRVLLELNLTTPVELYGMHDIFSIPLPPYDDGFMLSTVSDRIGTAAIPCPIEKIAGIVLSHQEDQNPRFTLPDDVSAAIANNIVSLLKQEISKKRLPKNFTFQSGFGAVANSVLSGLNSNDFGTLNMYTEVIQESALQMLLNGKLASVSATSLSFTATGRKIFYENLGTLRERLVIRPQEISNNGAIISKLCHVAMNTAIEADIYGNVNSTHIMGSSMMNGIGGSGDFARHSMLSIFMTPSTAKKGLISSIVPMTSHVDHTEHDVDILVTEYGYADLRGKSPRERAEMIIENCCHPEYKPLLRDYYEHAKEVSPSQHTPHDLSNALSWHRRYLATGNMKPENL